MLLGPSLRRRLVVGNQMLQTGIGQLVSNHRGIDFAVQQHLSEILACRRPLDDRRIAILGDVRILEGDPLDLVQVDAVFVGENAAHPGGRRDRVGTQAHALAREV